MKFVTVFVIILTDELSFDPQPPRKIIAQAPEPRRKLEILKCFIKGQGFGVAGVGVGVGVAGGT